MESEDSMALCRQDLGIFTLMDFGFTQVTCRVGQPNRFLTVTVSKTGVLGLGKYQYRDIAGIKNDRCLILALDARPLSLERQELGNTHW